MCLMLVRVVFRVQVVVRVQVEVRGVSRLPKWLAGQMS